MTSLVADPWIIVHIYNLLSSNNETVTQSFSLIISPSVIKSMPVVCSKIHLIGQHIALHCKSWVHDDPTFLFLPEPSVSALLLHPHNGLVEKNGWTKHVLLLLQEVVEGWRTGGSCCCGQDLKTRWHLIFQWALQRNGAFLLSLTSICSTLKSLAWNLQQKLLNNWQGPAH